jgi:hypothetical protein
MNNLSRLVFMLAGGYFLYKNRYKILNKLMSIQGIRQLAVASTMKIPGVREKFIQQAFRM